MLYNIFLLSSVSKYADFALLREPERSTKSKILSFIQRNMNKQPRGFGSGGNRRSH